MCELPKEVQDVVDKMAITEQLYRYARGLDRLDLDMMRRCFHDDATDLHGHTAGTAADLIEYVKNQTETILGSHFISNPLIELNADVAHSECYFWNVNVRNPREGELDEFLAGRYLDRWERREGSWRIADRRAVFDWARTYPATSMQWFNRIAREPLRGARGPGDPSYIKA